MFISVNEHHNIPLSLVREVDFCDTDAAGILHFSTYFRFMEAAEAKLFQTLEIPLIQEIENMTMGFPRTHVSAQFTQPLTFGDQVEIELFVSAIRSSRIAFKYNFYRYQNSERGEKVAEGVMETTYARRDAAGSLTPLPLPESWVEKLQA